MGDGNYSYASAAPPVFVQTDPDQAGTLAEYFFYVRVDGVDVTDDEAGFTSGTGVLLFGTAPADGAILEVAYLVDTTGSGVTYTPPLGVSGGRDFTQNWQTYQTE